MDVHRTEIDQALEVARTATQDAIRTATQNTAPGTTLVPAGADAAVAVKAQMAAAHATLAKSRADALEKVRLAREAIKAQQAELDRQAAALAAELEPLQDKLTLMQEGIWTMNLYLGRDEEITQLAEGAPAPAGTPIHVRQQVLAMDEESAINAEGGGIDFRNVTAFDEWVTSDPAHLDQLLPEPRGVVAIMARRTDVDYGDAWANVNLNKENRHTYWLIRNGQNVYRMDTVFEVGARLVPARNEFTSIFVDRFTKKPLEPGTQGWLKAEKAAGARERHFMRVALILQGLIDRTPVFHPLPKPGVSLLSPQDYDDGHVVLIADDENQITTGRVDFYQWLNSLNAQLRPGMRVMVETRHTGWPSRSRDGHNYDNHERITPPRAEWPQRGQVYTIKRKGRGAGEFVITYPRTQEEWLRDERGREELRVPKTPASCVLHVDDRFVLPIDLVDVPTMREYLSARTERRAYADMFPTLHAAIAFKEAEAAAEAPFRDLLAAQVAQGEDVDLDTAHQLIDPVIATWKVGALWFRPMTGDREAEARAAKEILAERARIVRANAGAGEDTEFVTRAQREHPDALLIARKKDGTYVVLTAAKRAWPTTSGDQNRAVPPDVWVHQHEYTRTGRARPVQQWKIPSMAAVSRWIVLHESEAWSTWNRAARAADHLSDPEIFDAIETIRSRTFDGLSLLAIGYDESGGWWTDDRGREFTAWYHPGPVPASPRPLTNPIEYLHARIIKVHAKRAADGSVTLRWPGRAPAANNTTSWDVPFNHVLDRGRTEQPRVPWNDNRGKRLVHLDEENFAAARRDADAWEAARHAASLLGLTAETVLVGAHREWTERYVAERRERFLEDYADLDLWAEEERRVREKAPLPWRVTKTERPWRALRYLVLRLVEDGRAPWGRTVAEAVAELDEPLNPRAGAVPPDRWEAETVDALPEDLLTLRFADEPGDELEGPDTE